MVVDDDGLIAQMLADRLREHGADVDVLPPEPADVLVPQLLAAHPDLAVVDLDLGEGLSALDILPSLVSADVPCLVFTGSTDAICRAECLAAGATGVVSKDGSFDKLLAAVGQALAGKPLLTTYERENQLAALREHRRREDERLTPFRTLTPQEAEVLGHLMRGQSVDEIAVASAVPVASVRTQVQSIVRQLQVSSQLAAVARAVDAGWSPPKA